VTPRPLSRVLCVACVARTRSLREHAERVPASHWHVPCCRSRMGGSTILIAVFAAIMAALAGFWAHRRSTTPRAAGNTKGDAGNQAKHWGVRIITSVGEPACPQVRKFLGKEVSIGEKPQLPLPDCPFPHKCQCGYIKLFDHRKRERRSGQERRQAGQRFERGKLPRRSGKDRRKKNVDWT
jgi:hypothetical protein